MNGLRLLTLFLSIILTTQGAYNDAQCDSRGGKCQTDSLYCGGSYVTGLCGGPTNRRCCVLPVRVTKAPLPGSGCSVNYVARAGWSARAPTETVAMATPVSLVFIHHTAGTSCSTATDCASVVRSIQNYHINTKGWADIGYNFLVGGDGSVYEGRGWDKVGAHTTGYNSRAVAISFIGDFTSASPTAAALQAAQNMIACGVQGGKLTSGYGLYGHRQAKGAATACPGDRLFTIIQGWKNYRTGTAP